MDELENLQRWYSMHCDGDWEHSYGITIESIDNPGWRVTIDLSDTMLSDCNFDSVCIPRLNSDESSWYVCRKEGTTYVAECSPLRLSKVISIFLSWASSHSDTTAWDEQIELLIEKCLNVSQSDDPRTELRSVYYQIMDIPNEHPRKKEVISLLETYWEKL